MADDTFVIKFVGNLGGLQTANKSSPDGGNSVEQNSHNVIKLMFMEDTRILINRLRDSMDNLAKTFNGQQNQPQSQPQPPNPTNPQTQQQQPPTPTPPTPQTQQQTPPPSPPQPPNPPATPTVDTTDLNQQIHDLVEVIRQQNERQTQTQQNRENNRNELNRYVRALNILHAAQRVYTTFRNTAIGAGNRESLAYRALGRTSAYTDYNEVRRVAGRIGADYGFNTETALNAANENVSTAGFDTDEKYRADLQSILSAAKVYGMDASVMANASGRAVALGTVQLGNQSEFANMLAESVVQAGMKGRESEQLTVLENILEVLSDTNTTVSRSTALSGLSLYNTIANANPNMRGERGGELATSMIGLAQSKNMTLDILAGFGTKYTGVSGRLALSELAELDPEQYYRQVAEGWRARFGDDSDDFFTYFLSNQLGSVSKAKLIVESLDSIQAGTSSIAGTESGEYAISELKAEWDAQGEMKNREAFQANVQVSLDNIGNLLNQILNLPKTVFNGMGEGGQTLSTFGGTLATSLIGSAGLAIGARGLRNVVRGVQGGTGALGAIGRGLGLNTAANAAAGVNGAIDWTTFGRTTSVAGAAIELGSAAIDSYTAYQEGDTRQAASRAGEGIGRAAGIWGGATIGTAIAPGIGTIVGAIAGYIAAGQVGEKVGEGLYDVANKGSPVYKLSHESMTQLREYADIATKLKNGEVTDNYGETGANASNRYIKSVIVPFLRSNGVSESITERYGFSLLDHADFLSEFSSGRYVEGSQGIINSTGSSERTIRSGSFGNSETITPHEFTVDTDTEYRSVVTTNTSALDSNTSALEYSIEELKNLNVAFRNFSIDLERTHMPLDFGTQSMQYNGNNVSTLGASTSQATAGNQPRFFQNLTFYSPSVSFPAVSAISNPVESETEENSHATGKEYVPYDRYPAMLHKGEMVLRKDEADEYRSGRIPEWRIPDFSFDPFKRMGTSYEVLNAESHETIDGNFTLNVNVSGGIDGMTNDNQQIIVRAILAELQQSDTMSMLKNSWTRVQNR